MKEAWKVVAAFVGVFIAGSVFGGFFSLGVGQRIVNRPPVPAPLQPQMMRMYSAQLDLNEVQRQRLEPLIDRADVELTKLRSQQFETSRAILVKLHRQFAAELNSVQKDKLVSIEQKQMEQQLRDRSGRGSPGPRGVGGRGGAGRGPNGQPLRGGQFRGSPPAVPAPAETTPAAPAP